ncbi:MAG: UpxY family transcription antiterminator [Flavobacteriaceae bacterium]|nr:UpxY family transcription antiterminator [Flavobacteriaceae bacterium]
MNNQPNKKINQNIITLFAPMSNSSNLKQKKWLVFYTKSRAEKKTLDYLLKFGFDAWLPTHKVLRQWSDRKKKLEVPLFNSYIFVNDIEANIPEVLKVPGISWNIRHNGKPAVLQAKEQEAIKRFIETGLTLETQAIQKLEQGQQVQVIDGPLKGQMGEVEATYNEDKLYVTIESLGQQVMLSIDKGLLKPL